MKKYLPTLVLLGVVVVAALVALSLAGKPASDELARQRKRLLADFASEAADELLIERGTDRLLCRRNEDGDWRIVDPANVRADEGQIDGVLDKLEMAEKVSAAYPDAGERWDLAEFGLKEPVRTVTITATDPVPRTWKLLVGAAAGVADAVHVAVEGDEAVYSVKADVTDATDVTLTGLRSRSLAPRVSSLDLTEVTVADATGTVTCKRAGDAWEIVEPFFDLADAGDVQGIAAKVHDHRIGDADFVSDDPTRAAEFGLDEPILTVTLRSEDGAQVVVIGRVDGDDGAEHYAMHESELPIVRVPESLVDDLRKRPGDLRERGLVDFWPDDVAGIELAGPGGMLALTKDGDAWRMSTDGGEPAPADREAVGEVVRALKSAKVDDFAADDPSDLAPFGLGDDQRLRVTLGDDDGEAVAELELGGRDAEGDAAYARRTTYPAVLELKADGSLDALLRGRVAFLDRLVLAEPEASAQSVRVQTSGPAFECVRSEEGSWTLTAPVTGKADQRAAGGIVTDFAGLRAAAFAVEEAEDLAPYGLDEPAVRVTVTYRPVPDAGGARSRTLLIGAPTLAPAEGRFAKVEGDARVFVLPDEVVGDMDVNLASKLICRPDDLTGLIVKSGDRELRVKYDEADLLWTDPQGGELPEATAAALREAHWTLRGLRGDRLVDLVEKDAAFYGFDAPYLSIELEEANTEGKRILIGREMADGARYAKGPETGYVLAIRPADVEVLMAVLDEPAR